MRDSLPVNLPPTKFTYSTATITKTWRKFYLYHKFPITEGLPALTITPGSARLLNTNKTTALGLNPWCFWELIKPKDFLSDRSVTNIFFFFFLARSKESFELGKERKNRYVSWNKMDYLCVRVCVCLFLCLCKYIEIFTLYADYTLHWLITIVLLVKST